MKKKLRMIADLRILLSVFAVVLGAMGIFAWAFRQIHIGYVEEDGHVVVSGEIYDRLSRGSDEQGEVQLTPVKSNDEVFSRGGKYYVGSDMVEYESGYPLYANHGQSLYFMDDSASLVTEDFELLTTYGGMYVADGTSFNADRQQADVETIYLVKLKNGLYENALPVTFTKTGFLQEMPVNCIVSFKEDSIRFYDEKSGSLFYHELTDVQGLTVQIKDQSFSYTDFLKALKGAGQETVQKTPDPSQQTDEEETEEELPEAELPADSVLVPSEGRAPEHQEHEEAEAEDVSAEEKEEEGSGDSQGGSQSAGEAGAEDASSEAGSSDESTGSGDEKENPSGGEENSSGGGQSQTRPGQGGGSSADPSYLKPSVTVKSLTVGTYTLDFDVEISDEGGYLKKLTSRVRWNNNNSEQRKSVKESGSYRISNLESDQEMVFILEMKYRNTLGEYVTEEVYRTTIHTLSIQEGTNTLYLDYLPDTWDRVTGTGGYEQIWPNQIEIRDLSVREGDDSISEDETSTMDYVRYFRIQVYEEGNESAPAATYILGASDRKKLTDGGLDWKSDQTMSPLDADKNYYYEFELLDRFGSSLKVVYEDGVDSASRYDEGGELLTGTASDRKAYTCKQHPTGKLSLGTASYDSQTITASLKNPSLSQVSDLYVTVKDSYGRYLGHTDHEDGTTEGSVETGVLTDKARFMLMEGVTTSTSQGALPLYAGVTGADQSAYDSGKTDQSWEKVKVPSFANSTYTIELNISYNIGDRYGDVDESGNHTGVYKKVLASRSNCKTTSLNTLGNVSFSRSAGDVSSSQIKYQYTSVEISEKLLPLIYRYDYTLTNTSDASDVPLTLRISREYEEIDEKQGVILTVPDYGDRQAAEWSFGYSYQYRMRTDNTRTVHTVSGKIWLDGSQVKRTILLDGEPQPGISQVTVPVENGDIYSAFHQILDLDTCAKVRATTESVIPERDVAVESAVSVTLDFPSFTDEQGHVEKNVNEDYAIGMSSAKLRAAFSNVKAEADQDFSDVILCALSRYAATLSVRVSGLQSAQIYEADAIASAYQSGNLGAKTDEEGNLIYGEVGEPMITAVTTTDSTLRINTLKGEPEVHMELFSTTSELTLFSFYVLDKDGAILSRKAGASPSVTVSIYRYEVDPDSGEAVETLIARKAEIPVAATQEEADSLAQDLVFSGLTDGTTYRIKVTAAAYDVTPDHSNTRYDYLIGESDGTTFWKENGVWENTMGQAVTTGLSLEEILSEDPLVMENQLIDFTTAEVEDSGWETGTLSTSTGQFSDRSGWNLNYRITPYIDLRSRDEDGYPVALSELDTFLLRGVSRIYYYDRDRKYLGYVDYYANGSDVNRASVVKLPEGILSGTNRGDYHQISDIVYARLCVEYSQSNTAFLGRLPDDYLTRKGSDDSAFTDVWGSLLAGGNLWTKLGSKASGSTRYETTDGRYITLSGYYEHPIPVKGGQVLTMTGSIATSDIERDLVFLDAQGRVICNEANGSRSDTRRVVTGILLVVPADAEKMLVQYSGNDETASRLGLYLLDAGIAEQYKTWRTNISEVAQPAGTAGEGLTVARKRYLNGSGKYEINSEVYESTSRIPVTPGDLYLMGNWGQRICYYDADNKLVGQSSGKGREMSYVIIPDGVRYISFSNYRWSTSINYDMSLLNGQLYNQNGSYPITFLKCGNLKTVYDNHRDENINPDQMYANVRIQLKDGVNNYFTDGLTQPGSYWLEVYETVYQGSEVSEEELLTAGCKIPDSSRGTIHLLSEGTTVSAEEVNRCRTIPVRAGYSYKVVLCASIGSRSHVELGDIYFTVREDKSIVRGISCAFQLSGVRGEPYGDYVLNKDITMDSDLYYNGGTLYGVLDLQGHTITNTRTTYIFDNVGSAAKKQGTIRNGTIVLKCIRDGNNFSRVVYGNYGTLENLNFKVEIQNPYTVTGGEKVYDNSLWTSQNDAWVVGTNNGTLQNFTVEYREDLVSCNHAGFLSTNNGLVQNGYVYGAGSVRGGSYVGGLVRTNNTPGIIRSIYSTIDVRANSTSGLGGSVGTAAYAGTIIGLNYGKAEGLLATGNVYQYTTVRSGSNYVFGSENYYTDRGCAVGTTSGRMMTSRCYYATVGNGKRVSYSATSLNERVETGLLVDPDWFRQLFGGTGLDETHLQELLESSYYPWVDMGAASEKYDILQPYLTLELGTSTSFDLVKSEVLEYVYDENGGAYARVRFTFMNPSAYEVTDILMDGLDCTLSGQRLNEDTGFYEAEATVQVSAGGGYYSSYPVKAVYYRRSANSSKSSVRYSYGTYVSANGERLVDSEFFYPLKNTKDWTEIFTSEHADWNFRIWGAQEWDFDVPYTYLTASGETKQRFPNPAKNFTYTGHLDGTLYAQTEDGSWQPVMDGSQVQCHVLKNLCDYTVNYKANGDLNGYSVYGSVFYQVEGTFSNLIIRDMTVGVEHAVHRAAKPMADSQLAAPSETLQTPYGELRQTKNGYNEQGLIRYLKSNSTMENVHLVGGYLNPYRVGSEYIGGLVGIDQNYNTYLQCSVTDLTIMTSSEADQMSAGGLVGYSYGYASFEGCYAADVDIRSSVSGRTGFNSLGTGGILGYTNNAVTLMDCYTSGNMTSQVMNTGGLVGSVRGDSTVSNCYSAVNLSLSNVNSGGLVGRNDGSLSIDSCLYTGGLSASSTSDTVHLILGYNTSSASLEECYVYQPHLEEGSSLLDAGVETKSYTDLTGSTAFYQQLLGDRFLYNWSLDGQTIGTGADQGAYLPAMGVSGEQGVTLASGQVYDGACHVPAIPEETLEITDVWAFASEDRSAAISAASGDLVSTAFWYDKDTDEFRTFLTGLGESYYDPNDIEFTLVLGSRSGREHPAFRIRSVEVEGLASGVLLGGNNNFIDHTGADGVFTTGMITSKSYRCDLDVDTRDIYQDLFAYRIRLLGAKMSAYQDVYNVVVTLDNGVVLKKTFQFCSSAGELEAKYLPIHNAYEWNLYLGTSGSLPQLAESADPDSLLSKYQGQTYQGYSTASMNLEISGEVDFSLLENIDGSGFSESPVMNVNANRVRGVTGTDGSTPGTIKNLDVKAKNTVYGLFRTVAGGVSDLLFQDNAVRWKDNGSAPSYSGLMGTVSGGMKNCQFKNTTLTGGGAYFGIMGSCDGTAEDIDAVNTWVESDSNYVGGLAGLLRGDLLDIEAYGDGGDGYQVTGMYYVGGLTGALYSTEHEKNGHEIIGGADYTAAPAGEAGRTDLNPDGWYSSLMSSENDYHYTQDIYTYDSLSYDYALVKDVELRKCTVTAQRHQAGGIAGRTSYIRKTMGYGYILTENVTLGSENGADQSVRIQAMSKDETNSYVGGLYGYLRTGMFHEIRIYGLEADGAGNYVGGLVGYGFDGYDYDYSAYGSGDSRVSQFLSAIDDVEVKDSTFRGAGYVGAVGGCLHHSQNVHAVKTDANVTLGEGNYVGGLFGYTGNLYLSDTKVTNQQVYNAGAESKYTGGVAGTLNGAGTIRMDASGILVAASQESSYVGGLAGYGFTMRDQTADSSRAANLYVYGHDYVGGLIGQSGQMYGITVNREAEQSVQVIGTGDYVGGLVGYTGSNQWYIKAQNLSVTGSGISTGGVFGKRYSGTLYNSDVSKISVTGSGTGTSEGLIWFGQEERDGLSNGSCVGGISGSEKNSGILYTRMHDVRVYGTGDHVGGLAGLKSYSSYGYMDIGQVTVHSVGSHNVGGMIGCLIANGDLYRIAADDVAVKAPQADCVGGMVGYMTSDNKNSGSIYTNTWKVTVDTGSNGTNYVGGLVGCADGIWTVAQNVTEATISAPEADYVGGLMGVLRQENGKRFRCYQNITAADVTGRNYVSGMIGGTGDYRLYGYSSALSAADNYYNTVAADVTATASDAVASYFYSTLDEDGQTVTDVSPKNSRDSFNYPYRMYLWDESSMTVGGHLKSASSQEFLKMPEGSKAAAGYWRGTQESSVTKTDNGNRLALVSTEDLKNVSFYNGGTDNLGLSIHTAPITDNKVNFTDLGNIQVTASVWNLYGLYPDMTTSWTAEDNTTGKYAYLPVPINPLLLCEDLASDYNSTDCYTGYSFGNAERDADTLTFSITGGISVPGTHGSILEDVNNTAGELADINLRTVPKIYAGNAYTLNVEFSPEDTYAGAVISVYTGTGETRTSAYEVIASGENPTYSMYYDFHTPLTIEIANAAPGSDGRYVAFTAEVDGRDYQSHICMGSALMYVIGSDAQLYQYRTSWSSDGEQVPDAPSGKNWINIVPEGTSSISVLSEDGLIWYASGTDENTNGKYLQKAVGPADLSSLGTSPAAAGGGGEGSARTDGGRIVGRLSDYPNLIASTNGVLPDLTEDAKIPEEEEDTEIPADADADASAPLEEVPEEAEDRILDADSDVVFDDSLLDAEPLYEFDYKGYHICTYLTYSLIFDGDQVTVRNMQLFAKNGQLFALNAPDEIVPGSILIDTYQGASYMTVLSRDGRLVDLMDEIHYPEDFVNRKIKNISTNLYSNLTYVQVEYEDGAVVTFNYLTGGIVYEKEGDQEGVEEAADDFLNYIMAFFREKMDIAWSEVSNAYQNALSMQDFLSMQSWKDWFAKDGTSVVNGTASSEEDASEILTEEEEDGILPQESGEGVPSQISGGVLFEDVTEGVMPETEAGTPAEFAGMPGMTAETSEEAEEDASDTAKAEPGDASVSDPETEEGDKASEAASEEISEAAPDGDAAEDGSQETFTDELIIAYDSNAKGYAVYSAQDLLTEEEEKLVSVDRKMEEYLDQGGKLTGEQPQVQSLEVGQTQKRGLIILFLTGGAIGCMLIILGVQRYSGKGSLRRKQGRHL